MLKVERKIIGDLCEQGGREHFGGGGGVLFCMCGDSGEEFIQQAKFSYISTALILHKVTRLDITVPVDWA